MGGHKAQRRYDTKVYEGTGEKRKGTKAERHEDGMVQRLRWYKTFPHK